jgi:hypothetical protein|tara:strand:+ start:763 stop:996 length:234 start_codon:yes stop_codon:yes gene_type:complete
MNRLVKSIRHIQIKKISYHPKLFEASITYEPHPTLYDESDDLEYQKSLMNKLIKDEWFCVPCENLERSRRLIDKHER